MTTNQTAQTSGPSTSGTTTSADGTELAWSRAGSGPDLLIVDCVGVDRTTTPQPGLPAALAEHFTVWTFDRRGKGDSGNTAPYAVEREFEDITAMIDLAEGRPVIGYGFSSGATLLLLAASAGVRLDRLTLLEPPLMPADPEYAGRAEAQRLLDTDLAEAHRWFNKTVVGIPDEVMEQLTPPSERDLANARSMVHELTFLPRTLAERFADLTTPTLIMASEATDPGMLADCKAFPETVAAATTAVLPGEWHGVDDQTLTQAIREFAG